MSGPRGDRSPQVSNLLTDGSGMLKAEPTEASVEDGKSQRKATNPIHLHERRKAAPGPLRLRVLDVVAVVVLALVGLDALEHLRVGAIEHGADQLLLEDFRS